MLIDYSLEMYITITAIIVSWAGCFYIVRQDWRHWGPLFLAAAFLGTILCYIFVRLHFYSFPYILLIDYVIFPVLVIGHGVPLLVLLGTKYSPVKWSHKILFYWSMIIPVMAGEAAAHNCTRLIKYELFWDFWDSLTAWWLFLLLFEWISEMHLPKRLRRPIAAEAYSSGGWGWLIAHFLMTIGLILAGVYLGFQIDRELGVN